MATLISRTFKTSMPTILLILISVCLLIYTYFLAKRTNVRKIIKRAAAESEFKQCEFVVYDKSSNYICDRLIIVKPFDWMIWNTRNILFIINPERPMTCGFNNVGAIRILRDTMYESCLNVTLKNLINSYTSSEYSGLVVKHIPYNIGDKTFTVLSAINTLVSLNLLKFDPDMKLDFNIIPKENIYGLNNLGAHVPTNISKRSVPTAEEQEIIDYNKRTEFLPYIPSVDSKTKTPEELEFEHILENPILEREVDYKIRIANEKLESIQLEPIVI